MSQRFNCIPKRSSRIRPSDPTTVLQAAGCILLLAAGAIECLGQEQATVGAYGDIRRWQIDGLVSFDPFQVREALAGDMDVLLAAHPRAPLDRLPTVVRERLRTGMLQSGRADAVVEAALDQEQQRLVITVQPGVEYTCGDVRIEGATQIPQQPLIDRLTEPYWPKTAVTPVFAGDDEEQAIGWLDRDGKNLSKTGPVWPPGKAAKLSKTAHKGLHRFVKYALEELGYHHASFSIDLSCDRETQRATLLVRIEHEGPIARCGTIVVSGNERNTDQAILDYLDLRPGHTFTRGHKIRLEHALWRSGRFLRQEVQIQGFPTELDGQTVVRLEVDVTESPHAPPINEPLSREAQTMMRVRNWLAQSSVWTQDMVIQLRGEDAVCELIHAPNRGVLVRYEDQDANHPYETTLIVSADRFGFYSSNESQFFEVPAPSVYFDLTGSVAVDESSEDPEKIFTISTGLGFHSKRASPTDPPFIANWSLHPAAAVAIPKDRLREWQWRGDTLTLRGDHESLTVHAPSGRILSYTAKQDDSTVRISFQANAFDQRLEKLAADRTTAQNAFDRQRAFTSTVGFFAARVQPVLEGSDAVPDQQRRSYLMALSVLRAFVELDLFRSIDEHLARDSRSEETRLTIPLASPSAAQQAGYIWLVVRLVPGWTEQCFVRNSWPWTVCREVAFSAVKKGLYTKAELQQFWVSDDYGPVSRLTVSALLQRFDARLSRLLATRGLRDTSVTEFRKDYVPLLDPNVLAGRVLQNGTEILRNVDQVAIDRLLDSLPIDDRGWAEAAVSELRRIPERSWDAALTHALDVAWENGLQKHVQQALVELQDKNAFRIGAGGF